MQQSDYSMNSAASVIPETNGFSKQQSDDGMNLQSELDSTVPLISYTSLKDLIPPKSKNSTPFSLFKDLIPSRSRNSSSYSKGLTIKSSYEVPITNLLLKKTTWIYLQPVESNSRENNSFCLPWIEDCFRFIERNLINKIVAALDKLVDETHASSRLDGC
ncbi:hypothetical protein V6N13_010743 [Hibiscus sabdariffa]|uniref:Uncharacterized protein n=2 Tax=Hibiscus sabdariffa TaxID=183260 RepID=A0ABR2A8D1_9ROSI